MAKLSPDSKITFPFNRTSLADDQPSSFWEEEPLATAEELSSPDRSWPDPFDAVPRPSWFFEKSGFAQWFRWPLLAALGLMILVVAGTAITSCGNQRAGLLEASPTRRTIWL